MGVEFKRKLEMRMKERKWKIKENRPVVVRPDQSYEIR